MIENWINEEVKIPKAIYSRSNYFNYFGVITGERISWTTCRDIFESWCGIYSIKEFYFQRILTSEMEKVAKFIEIVENKLKLSQEQRTIFRPTNESCVVQINWGKNFWHCNPLRRSLFTALLRASNTFNGSNFEEALWSQHYLNTTKKAVEKFLNGYTFYVRRNDKGGWHATFYNNINSLNNLKKSRGWRFWL